MLIWLHKTLVHLLNFERRFDPFFRRYFDALLQEPLALLTQALINLVRAPEPRSLATETILRGEEACVDAIVASMSSYTRTLYKPGGAQRAGNTKTHGVVRGRFIVAEDIPPALRHGLFAKPGDYPAWVRFAGPGPASPPDIDDVGVLSFGIKVMGVPGPQADGR